MVHLLQGVDRAARVAALAGGGEILVSESVAEVVDDCDDIVLGEQREVQLKGLSGAYVVTIVEWAASAIDSAAPRGETAGLTPLPGSAHA